jgi:head-tail adaptor
MAGGQLKHVVDVERLVREDDQRGGYVEHWETLKANVCARVIPVDVAAIEQLAPSRARVEAPKQHEVRMRWHPEWPLVTDRLIYKRRATSHVLMIRGIEHVDEDERWWRIWCVEELT